MYEVADYDFIRTFLLAVLLLFPATRKLPITLCEAIRKQLGLSSKKGKTTRR